MTKQKLVTILALVAAATVPALAGNYTFTPMGVTETSPASISDDGRIISGSHYFGAFNFYWSRAEGVVIIGGGCQSGDLTRVSGDGNTLVGCAQTNGMWEAHKYDASTGTWQPLGSTPGAVKCDNFFSDAYGLNYDGSKMVGLAWLAQKCRAHGGMWDLVGGGPAYDLGSIVPDRSTRANGISSDGNVIVGWQDDQFGFRQAAKWVNGVEEVIFDDNGLQVGEALATNNDGSVIVGTSAGDPLGYGGGPLAWRWVEGKGMNHIGIGGDPNNPFTESLAIDVTDDGRTVVGLTRVGPLDADGFIWTESKGYQRLSGWIEQHGITGTEGWDFQAVSAINADGTVMTGWGFNPQGFIEGWVIESGLTVCHNGETLRVSESGLNGHLSHGDTEGYCD